MRGAPDIGVIQARNEVEPHGTGYRGIIVIAGQGRWQTPDVDTKEQATIMLAALNANMLPKPKGDGFSEAQKADINQALNASA